VGSIALLSNTANHTHVEIKVTHAKAGLNLGTYKKESSAYWLIVTPQTRLESRY
jgi:hypothetical protein